MIPVENNREYTISISSVSSDGCGVGNVDGFTVFVPYTAPGDVARIRITSVRSRFARGCAVEIEKSSPLRADPVCSCYYECGGCQLRHIKYEEQLNIKKDIVEDSMRRIGGFKDFSLDSIIGMEYPERYRNKMMFSVGEKNSNPVCGFYMPHSHDIIKINDCYIGDELNRAVIAAVTDYMSETGVRPYDENTHTGIIRRIFTRKAEGGMMVVICANAKSLHRSRELVARLRAISDKIVSIILNVNTKRNDPGLSDKNVILWGTDKIRAVLYGIDFLISPQSFFQINPVQTEKLYSCALDYATLDKSMSVLDIYCGIGTISLCAARNAGKVTGIEIVERAILDARENAKRNKIKNVRFFAGSAEKVVPHLIDNGTCADVVFLDPPRKGSDTSTLCAILSANPKRIVYISCNPATLARDAKLLFQNGYSVSASSAFDMFPYTGHVETVVLMSRKAT